mgnify:CR=1 FL=1
MVILNPQEASKKVIGTSYKGVIHRTYFELEHFLGTPTFENPTADGKVQKQWVVKFEGNIFTIYDYKAGDEHVIMFELDKFHVGGKKDATRFIEYLEEKVPNLDE